MFNRRARQAAAKHEHGQLRPQKSETATLGHGVRVRQAGDGRDHRHRADDRLQPVAPRLRPVTPRIDSHVQAHRVSHSWHPSVGIAHEPAHRCSTDTAARSIERVGAEPLGPPVQRRVRRRPLAELRPRHLPQAPPPSRVLRHLVLDHHQPVGLARQCVAGQHPRPGPAPRASRKCYARGQMHRLENAVIVWLQQHQATRNRRPRQPQAPARSSARIIWGSPRPPIAVSRPSTAARTRDTTSRW